MIVRTLLGRLGPQQLIALARRLRPDGEFLICDGERLTRRQVFARVEALAAGLAALGIGPGDKVATLLPACPEAVYTLFLPWVLGNVEVPLHPLYREHELRHILADCGARAVFTSRRWCGHDYPAMLAALRSDLPELRHVIVREAAGDAATEALSVPELLVRGGRRPRVNIAPGALGRISYTSGTTGLPRGVAHALGGYWGLAHSSAGPRLDLGLLRCLLLPFPPYHYAGWLGVMGAFLAGGKVILMERPDPPRMLACIQAEGVSQIGASPTLYRLLLRVAGQERYDLSSVRRVTVGGEPCPPDLARALHERFGCPIENYYGMTECGIISWTGPEDPWERAATTVGRPAPGVELRIVDDAGRPLPPGERGEIAVRTRQMMLGYYRDPEHTARVLDVQGWFHTGDIGRLGDDGYLRLVDRKKDLVIRGGQNIFPAEVEQYLERHPAVRRAAVIGMPDALRGQALWAFVEPAAGVSLERGEVLRFCQGRIAPFKIPDVVRLVEHLPLTATGKVQKYRLRELAVAEASSDRASIV